MHGKRNLEGIAAIKYRKLCSDMDRKIGKFDKRLKREDMSFLVEILQIHDKAYRNTRPSVEVFIGRILFS